MRLLQIVSCFVFASMAGLIALEGAAAQEIRYKFEQGEKLSFNMTQNMEMLFKSEGVPDRESTTSQLTEMSWTVNEVRDDGTAQITQSIDRIKMSLAAPPNVNFEYDSAAAENPTGAVANMIKPVLEAMVGAQFAVTMNPRGDILEIEVPDTVVEAMQKVPNAAQMGEMFSKEGFENMIQQGSLTFPEGELEPGRKWSNKFEMQSPGLGGKQTITTNYEYLGQEEVDGQMLDAFAVSLNLDFGEAQGAGGAKVGVKNQESSGKIYFDREAGHMKTSNIEMAMTMEIDVLGRTMTSELKQNVKVDVKKAE